MPKFPDRFLPACLTNGPERVAFLALAGAASLVLVSIAASQILLAAGGAATVWLQTRRRAKNFVLPPVVWPLVAFFLWTLVTIGTAPDRHLAVPELKKFLLYLILLVVPAASFGRGSAAWIYSAIFAVVPVSAGMGLWQFIADPHRDLLHRISGFMSQWMTYSGLLMLVLVALCAFTLSLGWRRHWWTVPLGLLILAPLVLSETRSAWLGAVAGIAVVVLLKRPRALLTLLVVVLVAYIISPATIKRRFHAGFDPADPNTRNRIELFETASRLVRANPWLGVGPKNVAREALEYRGTDEFPDWMYQHMHNNLLQIAAERGITGLLLWLWLMGRLAWDALRVFRSAKRADTGGSEANDALVVSTAALGAWTALLVAGMFEYNFGDSEVLVLFLFMMALPYSFLGRGAACTKE